MSGRRTFTNRYLLLFGLAAAAYAQTAPEYFPLQPGNSWVYKVTQARSVNPGTINVGAVETIEGQPYYRVDFFGRSVLLRQGSDGSLLAWDGESKTESTWLPLGAPEKQTVPVSFDACSRSAWVDSRSAKLTTTLGDFSNALQVRFNLNCSDAGTTSMYFLPYVGLVHFETTSIAGPILYDLMYSRTGFTNIDSTVNAFTAAVDNTTFKAGDATQYMARTTLRVSQPLKLTFPSGQSTELRITNEKGATVFLWSSSRNFVQIVREEQVGPGEKNWAMAFTPGQFPPGKYRAEAWLTTNPVQYTATVSFEVVP